MFCLLLRIALYTKDDPLVEFYYLLQRYYIYWNNKHLMKEKMQYLPFLYLVAAVYLAMFAVSNHKAVFTAQYQHT